MSLLHIVVVISMDKLISFECDNNNRKIPFKKNRRLSTHIVRSYSSSQFEKSSTNSNSNYIKLPKINLLINNHVCLMWGMGGGGRTNNFSLFFIFYFFIFLKFPQQLLLHLIDLHSNNSYSKIMVEMKRKKKGVLYPSVVT